MLNFRLRCETVRGYAIAAPAKSGAGVSVPEFIRAHSRAQCGFFVCEALLHLSMVGCVGASKGAPGSLMTGNANSAQSTTSKVSVFCGGLTNLSSEDAVIMADSTRLKFNWRFLALPDDTTSHLPVLLHTHAYSEAEARHNLSGWRLYFAARLPLPATTGQEVAA